jgi:hypothetical protein
MQQQRRVVDQRAQRSRRAGACRPTARADSGPRSRRGPTCASSCSARVAILARVEAAQLDLHQHVGERGTPVEEHRTLEHDAEVRLRPVDRAPGDAHHAGRRQEQARDQAQERALAASGRPDDREELALADRKVDVLERVRLAFLAPIGLRDIGDLHIVHRTKVETYFRPGAFPADRGQSPTIHGLNIHARPRSTRDMGRCHGRNSFVWKVVQVLSVDSSR